MPSYRAINKRTGRQIEFFCSISEMEQWQETNKNVYEVLCGAPGIHGGWITGEAKSDGWNDVLKTVKKSHPGSTIKLQK